MPAKKAIITVKSSGLFVLPEETNHGDTWFNSLGTIPLPQRPPLENPLDKLGPLDNGVGNCFNHSCSEEGEVEI